MKPISEQIMALIPEAMRNMYLNVKQTFHDNKVVVTASYNRHVAVSMDLDLFDCSEGQALDQLTLAARQASEQLKDEIRQDVAK